MNGGGARLRGVRDLSVSLRPLCLLAVLSVSGSLPISSSSFLTNDLALFHLPFTSRAYSDRHKTSICTTAAPHRLKEFPSVFFSRCYLSLLPTEIQEGFDKMSIFHIMLHESGNNKIRLLIFF